MSQLVNPIDIERTLTENCGPTFGSSADPRVDFFFHVTEGADKQKTIDLLTKSWECHPLDTLKLIAFMRDIRNGKGIRSQYQMSLFWLFNNHFQTLIENLEKLVEFGYWKDILHLLVILLFDGLIPDYMAKDDGQKVAPTSGRRTGRPKNSKGFPIYDRLVLKSIRKEKQKQRNAIRETQKTKKLEETKDVSKDIDKSKTIDVDIEKGVKTTRAEALEKSRKVFAESHYKSDEKYRKLYDKIVELFAKQLVRDLEGMSKNVKSISLAGKWVPTYRHHFDKYLFISLEIGREMCRLMNRNQLIDNSAQVIDFYRKEVCTPLRKYLKIPEVYMCSTLWSQIDYNRVTSKCMQKNKSLFIKYDENRFKEFLESKKTVSGAALKPVELVTRGLLLLESQMLQQYREPEEQTEEQLENIDSTNNDLEKEVLEKQWLSLTEDIIKKGGGLLDNSLAVCDVSGSMSGTPMYAAIGLTILVMTLSREPWNSVCITFDENPSFQVIDPNDKFLEKLKTLQAMKWGGTTNLNKVFDLILLKATEQRLTQQQMPKLLFVFTDMEFNSAFPDTSMTNFEAAKQQFEVSGYQLPAILFWNLRGDRSSTSTPVLINEYGSGLMSGYSGQLLSLILKLTDLKNMNPFSLMRSAIDHNRYSNLTVID